MVAGVRNAVRHVEPIQQAWVDFLGARDWQWFATCTYKDPIHPEAADKQFRLWTRLLDEANGVKRRKPRDSAQRCIWVRGLEWQKRGVLHFHALMGRLPAYRSGSVDRATAELHWLQISGGFARVDNVHSAQGAMVYVSKYCLKGGEVDFSANLTPPDLLAASVPAA